MRVHKSTTYHKYRAIYSRYDHLYKVKRIRLDDVLATLCKEFFLSNARLMKVLQYRDEVLAQGDPGKEEGNQLKLF